MAAPQANDGMCGVFAPFLRRPGITATHTPATAGGHCAGQLSVGREEYRRGEERRGGEEMRGEERGRERRGEACTEKERNCSVAVLSPSSESELN